MKNATLYLVCMADEFELPVFCGTKDESMQYLGIQSDGCFYCDVSRGTKVQNKYIVVNSGVKEACL